MALGTQAAPPRGFVQFCERLPGECGASSADLQAMEVAASRGAPRQVAAITYDWSTVFPQTGATLNAAPSAANNAGPASATAPEAGLLKATWTPAPTLSRRDAPSRAPALKEIWPLLTSVNDRINRSMVERTDQEIYGVSEYWAMPLEAGLKVGDCEDYALEKRHALIAAGVPAQLLSIAVVSTVRGDTHAVLLVATDHGEYVLDNLSAWVVPWTQAGYTWRERQVAGSPSQWAYAAGAESPATPGVPAPTLVLASAR